MFGKEKMRVEIITHKGLVFKNCEVQGDYVIIKKGKGVRGNPTIKAKFSRQKSVLPWKTRLGFLKQKVMVKSGLTGVNKECVKFYGVSKISMSYPDLEEYFNAGAMKNAGTTLQKMKTSPILIVLNLGIIIMIVILFLTLQRGMF